MSESTLSTQIYGIVKPTANPANENTDERDVMNTLSLGLNQLLLRSTIEFNKNNFDTPINPIPTMVQ